MSFTIGGAKQVYKKVYTDENFDFLSVRASVPVLELGVDGNRNSMFGFNESFEWSFTAQTSLKFSKTTDISWFFCFMIFGFGISITRQWSY